MNGLKELIKRNRILKRYRVRKWIRYSRRMMFSAKEVARLEKDPSKIRNAVYSHVKSNPYASTCPEDLDRLLERSYLAGSGAINDALKTDMLFWYFAYGFSFNEYLCYRFYEKTKEERLKFFSDRDSVALGYNLNDIDDMMVFGDKMNTYNMFRDYFGREAISLESERDYNSFVDFVRKHRRFVKKDVLKACGESVQMIDADSDGRSERELFEYLMSEGKVILEEVVRQHECTAVFNASSVNTIRCITVATKNNDVLVPYCFMRTGRDGAFIDNGFAGGLFVGVDPETGTLGTDGVVENGVRYSVHPDSKVPFKGYPLPEWDKMISMCKEMALKTPTVRMIGWDTAYTDKGWVVIEGNALTEVIGPQCTWLKGIRSEIKDLLTKI